MSTTDVGIIGGGVIGLSIAWRLAQAGVSVAVLDAGSAGQASSAAAGMLAPLAETRAHGPLVTLGIESLRRYPAFLAALRDQTGSDIELSGPGMLRVAASEAEEDALCQTASWQMSLGLPLTRLSGDDARRIEPALAKTVRAGILSPDEKHVTPRRLLEALHSACERHGVIFRHGRAKQMLTASGHVISMGTEAETLSCGTLLITGGAWSGEVGSQLGFTWPITPLRGQILSLGPQEPLPITHTIYGTRGYLVPRADGRVIVGATEDAVGYDTGTTTAGMTALLQMAMTLAPGLSCAPFDSVWTGLRPVSADGLPLLGPAPRWDNVYVAGGHGRNGILLTPITGDLIADAILHQAPVPPAFSPARFEEPECPPLR